MEMLLALLLQSAIPPDGAAAAPPPRLAYANEAAADAPRPRVNQGRGFRMNFNALDQSLASEAREERRPAAPTRTAPSRPGRTSMWNGVPVRMINGQPHGLW